MTHISCPLWRHFMRQYCISTSKYMPSCMSFKTQGQNRYVGSQTLRTVGYCAIQSFCLSTVMKKSHYIWELNLIRDKLVDEFKIDGVYCLVIIKLYPHVSLQHIPDILPPSLLPQPVWTAISLSLFPTLWRRQM